MDISCARLGEKIQIIIWIHIEKNKIQFSTKIIVNFLYKKMDVFWNSSGKHCSEQHKNFNRELKLKALIENFFHFLLKYPNNHKFHREWSHHKKKLRYKGNSQVSPNSKSLRHFGLFLLLSLVISYTSRVALILFVCK